MIVGFFPATTMPDAEWWQALWPDPTKVLVEMGVQPGMVVVDLCCGDGLFTAPLARIAESVYAIDIDPAMLDRARAFAAAAGATNCHFALADAMTFDAVVPQRVDYVFLANTFHGVPDQPGLARAVAAVLKPKGQIGVVNWHCRPREETVVLGRPRGPRTEMRIEARDVALIVKPAGLLLNRTVELPPYHYGAIFVKEEESMSEGLPIDAIALREEVKSKYRAVAVNPHGSYHFHTGGSLARRLGYDEAVVSALPESAVEAFAGVGNPFSLGALKPGERVVDLGSGGGFDCFIAAGQVGPQGRVVGVDMTEEMLGRSRGAATALGLPNVEFHQGVIEDVPIEDGWADVVISNGVINLCADKRRVFSEIMRMLKPGGRLQFADIATGKPVPEAAIRNIDLWTD
jgi:ubiquinone/menaquinone biosynthesis C-methylase UbiE